MRKTKIIVASVICLVCFSTGSIAMAEEGKKLNSEQNLESTGASDEYVSASTKIDFNETLIDGKMKAPQGFMLSGRQSQSLTQMVKLRSNFRNELKNSNAVVNTLVK